MTKSIKLLLVEDTPSDIRLTQEALRDSGLDYSLDVVNDGEQAMQYLNVKKNAGLPDIILLDLNMPKKNGHEVLADIAKDQALKKIPVVLLTVSQRDEDVLEALRLKMNYYLPKPIDANKLSSLVSAIFALNSQDCLAAGKGELSEEDIHVRYVLASNPHTSPSVLKKLASEANHKIRAKAAENSQMPDDVLEILSGDDNAEVRSALACNPKVSEAVLEKLIKDKNEDVRLSLAENAKLPVRLLTILAADENTFVAAAAAKSLSK